MWLIIRIHYVVCAMNELYTMSSQKLVVSQLSESLRSKKVDRIT